MNRTTERAAQRAHSRAGNRQRGGVLLLTLLVATAVAGLALVAHDRAATAAKSSQSNDNLSRAETAAEYGAELAVAQLAGGLIVNNDTATIESDWVRGANGESLFRANGATASDQRRIQGFFDDREFRVRVRSARLAHENGTMPESWLRKPNHSASRIGKDYAYGDIYEITATARDRDGTASAVNPGAQAVVRTVIEFRHENPLDDLLNRAGLLHNELPENFQATGNENREFHYGDDDARKGVTAGVEAQTRGVYNILITGEDHYLSSRHIDTVYNMETKTPLKVFTNEANYFGATGAYWANGCLTLNYQVDPDNANPYRPRTPVFGGGVNREMKVLDSSRTYDSYLLGGKKNATVTLDDQGRIKETNAGQVTASDNFNIVLNAFEDLMNLYINMAGITAQNTYPDTRAFEDPNQWFRMYIGQYTEGSRHSTADAASLSTVAGTRIRPQTIHTIRNKDGHTLVREYVDSRGKLYNYPARGASWKGNYTWANATFVKVGDISSRFALNNSTASVVPRLFGWQELTGYSLAKRSNGHPDLRSGSDKRTYFRLDNKGKRIAAGFDERFQQLAESDPNCAPTDRNDVINVRQANGSLKACDSMDDFMFEKDFGVGKDNEQIKRMALAVFIGYEDQREHQADYNYTDMMFTIYVAPGEAGGVKNEPVVDESSLQWWERDEKDGLTGKHSHTALTTNQDPSTEAADDPLRDNFALLGHTPRDKLADHVYTMLNTGDNAILKFPRAQFATDAAGHSTGVLLSDLRYEYFAQGISTFYYSEGDVLDYVQRDPLSYYLPGTGLDRERVIAEFHEKNLGAVFKAMDDRWDSPLYDKSELADSRPSSYAVIKDDLLLRTLAGKAVGFQTQEVPAVKTDEFARLTSRELGIESQETYPAPERYVLGFLAGEFKQSRKEEDRDRLVANGRMPVKALPPNTDAEPAGDRVLEFLADDPAAAVAMCYRDYHADDPESAEAVADLYGMKDKRRAIGFHRGGTSGTLAEKHLRDRYEVVLLGVSGFNPYREVESEGKRHIALEAVGEIEDGMFACAMKYACDDDPAPDFVFDKPIDGAGTMVVNGNLVVADDFAYHGTLLVLGDVVVRPTLKKDQLVYGEDGNPVDKHGNRVHPRGEGWYYVWTNPDYASDSRESEWYLDDSGAPQKDDNGQSMRVEPLRESLYRGHLIVQGNLLVKGRLRTETVANTLNGGEPYTGKLSLFWSQDAVEDTADNWAEGKSYTNRVSWSRDSGIDVAEIWENKID